MHRFIYFLVLVGFVMLVDIAAYFQHTVVLNVVMHTHYFIIPTLLGAVFGTVTIYILHYYALARKNEQFAYYAKQDYLTNIYNRYGAELLFEQEQKKFARNNEVFSMIMFDVDHFKKVNDTYGHKEGDRILIELVSCVKKELRDMDIFSRWGGEEFLILLPNTTLKQAVLISERVRKRVENTQFMLNESVTISLGVVAINKQESIRTLIKQADEALYKAKEQGRNRSVSFEKQTL